MNAIEIIERVRAHDAELTVENDRLILRGHGEPLPADLQAALSEHKAELLVALGVPFDRTIAAILSDVRPHLPSSLRRLPDSKLLTLVNWAIINAWGASLRKLEIHGRG